MQREEHGELKLLIDTANHTYRLIDGNGGEQLFADFSTNWDVRQRGTLLKRIEPGGRVSYDVVSWTTNFLPGVVRTTYEAPGSGTDIVEELAYAYEGTTDRINSVTFSRGPSDGTIAPLRTVQYAYYGSGESHGNAGDLKHVTIRDGDANATVRSKEYYRWYTSDTATGYTGGLKMYLSGESYQRAEAEFGSGNVEGIADLVSGDLGVRDFADNYFEYDSSKRVTKEIAQDASCSCTSNAGQGEFNFAYSDNATATGGDRNKWDHKTIEYLPDHTAGTLTDNDQNIVYTNQYGQPILKILNDTDAGQQYLTYFEYDAQGQVTLETAPQVYSGDVTQLTGFSADAGRAAFLDQADIEVTINEYFDGTTAPEPGLIGYLKATYVQHGDDVLTRQKVMEYTYTDGGINDDGVYFIASETQYAGANGTDGQATSYAYTWHVDTSSNRTNQMKTRTTTRPLITSSQNGPDTSTSSYVEEEHFDTRGHLTWTKDAKGYVNYYERDVATGAVKKQIIDADPSAISNPAVAGPTRGSGLPTALALTTEMEVDDFGRTTKLQDPNGNVTYTVYDDTAYDGDPIEIRTYAGWNSTTKQPTGPISVWRSYPELMYTEELTYTWSDEDGLPIDGSGVPDGSEDITDATNDDDDGDGDNEFATVHSLTRDFTNRSGQVIQTDAYHSFTGISYSTVDNLGIEGTNFHRTHIGYNDQALVNRVVSPTGTVTRYVYDGRGNVISTWVGTDDEPSASGTFWSPTNTAGTNLVKVLENAYDDDSNLIQAKQFTAKDVTGAATGGTTTTLVDTSRTEPTNSFVGRTIRITGGTGAGQSARITAYNGSTKTFTLSPSLSTAPDATSTYMIAAERATEYAYDWRNRLVAIKAGAEASSIEADTTGAQRQVTYRTLDNLGRVTGEYRYDGDTVSIDDDANSDGVPDQPSEGNLRAKTSYEYDDQDRLFRATVHSVDQATGSPTTGGLVTNVWYDLRGNVIKTSQPGGLVRKMAYDGAGRETVSYTTDGGGDSVWGDADNVTGDKVLEQTETLYDVGGNQILITTRQRFHDATDTGALGNPSSASGTARSRVSYRAMYYDAATRPTADVDFGTNGGTLDGTGSGVDLDADNNSIADRPTIPSRADDVLVTSYEYDDAGRLWKAFDPRGIEDRTSYDLLGRTTKVVEAYVDGTPSAADDRTTEYTYTGSGNVLTMKAVLPGGAFQETKYVYGESDKVVSGITRSGSTATATSTAHGHRVGESITVSGAGEAEYNGTFVITAVTTDTFSYTVTGTPATPATGTISVRRAHDLYSNDLLTVTQYPDKSTGSASSSEQDTFVLNALGERKHVTDRNGSVHTYSYDLLGRLTGDLITWLGSGVGIDDASKLGYTYDTAGRPEKFTSYDDADEVINEVQRAYNGFGQLVTEYQEHAGPVSTSTSPKVQYAYTELSGGNHSRLKSVTYPNGRILRHEYASGLDDTISRLSFLADDASGSTGTHLEEYSYLGLGTIVERKHPESDVDLTYIKQGAEGNGDAGDQYTGLDRFGRVVDQRWRDTGDGSHTDRFAYGYDRNSNRVYRDNVVNSSFSELYVAEGVSFNDGYDKLDRLTHFGRGGLDISTDMNGNRSAVLDPGASRTQSWTLDALGNWSSVTTDADGDGGGTPTAQSRTHNAQNQLTQVGSNNLAFDDNGNTTTDDAGRTLAYDAWNRLASVTPSGGSATRYEYDALGRRISETPAGGTTRDHYHSNEWQVLEETEGGTAKTQYVWSPVYVDAMVLRDQLGTGTGGTTAGSLDTSFDGDGKAITIIGSATDSEIRAVTQVDGKVVVLGSAGGNIVLARYNDDGTLDTTFDTDGIVVTDFGGTELGQGLAMQSDGKIVITGHTSSGSDAILARYNANGSLDTTFDTDGKRYVGVSGAAIGAVDVVVDGSGNILFAAWSGGNQHVYRFTSSGALDTTYAGGAGFRTIDFGGGDTPLRMTLDGSGRVVVVGMTNAGSGDATLARLTTSGDLDTTFSTDGKLMIDFGGSADEGSGVAIDASGNIVVGGTGGVNADLVVARVTSNGTLDTSFSTDGLAYASFGPGADEGEDLVIDGNGRIVIGGTADANTAFAVARFNTDGTLDSGFDTDGKVRIDFASGTTYESAEAMTLQGDGKIVIAGRAGSKFAVARLHAETSGGDERLYVQQDANFNVTAITDASGSVVERYIYDPYGQRTVLNADWTTDADGFSDIGWLHLHQGGRYDAATALYHFRNRDYSPTLGRWVQQDPLRYVDGLSMYNYIRSSPINFEDPFGHAADEQDPYGGRFGDEEFRDNIWNACPQWYIYAGLTAARARTEAANRYPGEKQDQHGSADAFRHCLWTCLMTSAEGDGGCSKYIADQKEYADERNHAQTQQERKMDEHNNWVGFEWGVAIYDRYPDPTAPQGCPKSNPEEWKKWTDEIHRQADQKMNDCVSGCEESLKNGTLKTF